MTAELSPENVLSAQHEAWLNHPCTIQMIKNFESYKRHLTKKLSASAGSTTPDSWFHHTAIMIKTTDYIKEITTKTEQFVLTSNKKD